MKIKEITIIMIIKENIQIIENIQNIENIQI
jgi:hypothetical protein